MYTTCKPPSQVTCESTTRRERSEGPCDSAKHDALDTYLSLARGGGGGGGGAGDRGGDAYALAAVEAIAGWLAEAGVPSVVVTSDAKNQIARLTQGLTAAHTWCYTLRHFGLSSAETTEELRRWV